MATPKQTIVAGPWGRQGGGDWDDGSYTGVQEINLKYGVTPLDNAIGYFQAIYDMNGNSVPGPIHGNTAQNFKHENIRLVFPDEYIVSVSGFTGPLALTPNVSVVRSLTFQTNRKTYGPYGVEQGIRFNFPIDSNYRAVGFKGATGDFLNALGLHIA